MFLGLGFHEAEASCQNLFRVCVILDSFGLFLGRGEGHLEGELLKFSRCDFIPVKSVTNKPRCLGSVQPQGTGKTVDAGEGGTCLAPGAGRRCRKRKLTCTTFEQCRLTSCTWLGSALPGLHLDRECCLLI